MDLEEIKSRINPQYQDVLGTESYERKWLCDEIERLRKERDELEKATKRWLKAADDWLETGVPATPKESESIYEQARVALAKVGADRGE